MPVDQARLELLTITDNSVESLRINFDGERFALVHIDKAKALTKTILLNPGEALTVEKFLFNSLLHIERR